MRQSQFGSAQRDRHKVQGLLFQHPRLPHQHRRHRLQHRFRQVERVHVFSEPCVVMHKVNSRAREDHQVPFQPSTRAHRDHIGLCKHVHHVLFAMVERLPGLHQAQHEPIHVQFCFGGDRPEIHQHSHPPHTRFQEQRSHFFAQIKVVPAPQPFRLCGVPYAFEFEQDNTTTALVHMNRRTASARDKTRLVGCR
jgi:hypothetical protein